MTFEFVRLTKLIIYIFTSSLFGCNNNYLINSNYHFKPVLFVHGHGMSPGNWTDLMNYLIRSGYPREYLNAVDIRPNDLPNIQAATDFIEPAAESLLTNAEKAAKEAGYEGISPRKLNIVSHSMGAVSSRWYATKIHPEFVHIWISLAGANHGTNALCSFNDEAAKEMCPAFATTLDQSEIQVVLNGTVDAPIDETPFGIGLDKASITRIPPDSLRSILYFTIRIEPDEWIKPEHSAILDGAGGKSFKLPAEVSTEEISAGNFLFHGKLGLLKKEVDHTTLLFHPKLHQLVASLLSL